MAPYASNGGIRFSAPSSPDKPRRTSSARCLLATPSETSSANGCNNELASHNDDIDRLLTKGYALRVDGAYLVVRDIPYLDGNGERKLGAIVTQLVFIDKVRVQQHDHQVFFAGAIPHGLDGSPIPNLAGGPTTIPLIKTDVVVERAPSRTSLPAASRISSTRSNTTSR